MAIDSQRGLGGLVLTAQHGETEEKASDLGVHDYLGTPVPSCDLIARARAVLSA